MDAVGVEDDGAVAQKHGLGGQNGVLRRRLWRFGGRSVLTFPLRNRASNFGAGPPRLGGGQFAEFGTGQSLEGGKVVDDHDISTVPIGYLRVARRQETQDAPGWAGAAGLERLGLDAAIVRATRPALAHCVITGFGPGGPYRGRPAYDIVIQGASGVAGAFERQQPRWRRCGVTEPCRKQHRAVLVGLASVPSCPSIDTRPERACCHSGRDYY